MTVTTVSNKGWIVIPAELRRKYGLTPGTRVVVVDYGGVIAVVPALADPIEERLQGCSRIHPPLRPRCGPNASENARVATRFTPYTNDDLRSRVPRGRGARRHRVAAHGLNPPQQRSLYGLRQILLARRDVDPRGVQIAVAQQRRHLLQTHLSID